MIGERGSGAMGNDFWGSFGKLVNKIYFLMQDTITGTQESKRNQSSRDLVPAPVSVFIAEAVELRYVKPDRGAVARSYGQEGAIIGSVRGSPILERLLFSMLLKDKRGTACSAFQTQVF